MNSKDKDGCCLCGSPSPNFQSANLTQISLDFVSRNFCNLLHLPYYPYGQDLLRLHWCLSCNDKIKDSGNLIKKLEQISSQISKCRLDLEQLILSSQVNVTQDQNSPTFQFRQNIITKLKLAILEDQSSSLLTEEEFSVSRNFASDMNAMPPINIIKEEIYELNELLCENSPCNDQETENTDFESDENSQDPRSPLIIKPESNESSELTTKKSRNKLHVNPDFILSSGLRTKSDHLFPNVNKKKPTTKKSFRILTQPELEELKKRAKCSNVQVSLRRLESLSQKEILELISSTIQNTRKRKRGFGNKLRNLCFNPQFESKTNAKNQVQFQCLVPGCGKVIYSISSRFDHKFSHLPQKLPCSLCPSEFNNPRALKTHLKTGKHKLKSNDLFNLIYKEFRRKMVQLAEEASNILFDFQTEETPISSSISPLKAKRVKLPNDANIDDLNILPVDLLSPIIPSRASKQVQFKPIHVDDKIAYKCLFPGCDQIFKSQFAKLHHRFFHSKEQFPCPFCKKILTNPEYLRRHLIYIHKRPKKLPRKTKSNSQTNRKIVTNNKDETNSESEDRETSKSVKEHPVKEHAVKALSKKSQTVSCEFCGKLFNGKTITAHRYSHLKNFTCEVCDKKYTTSFRLREHRKNVHNLMSEEKEKWKKQREATVCPICGVLVCGNWRLKRHMVCHEDPLYVCPVKGCGKSFRHRSSFGRHSEFHKGERPYICPKCGKNFSNPLYYRVHVRTHSQVKKYTCEICRHSFNVREYLYVHYRKHREKDEKKGILNSPAIQLLKEFSKEKLKSREVPKRVNKGLNTFDEEGNLI